MKNLTLLVAAVVLATACHSKSDNLRRDQQQYDVVQEGSASGVTSTIGGVAPPSAAMTATNADTTSNFTLPTVTSGTTTASGQPGTLAGTLPADQSGSMNRTYPSETPRPRVIVTQRQPAAAAAPAPKPVERHEPPPPMTSGSNEPAPPPTTTTATDTAPPATDTTTTKAKSDKSDKPKPDDQQPPSTDTAPPPPPTTTTG